MNRAAIQNRNNLQNEHLGHFVGEWQNVVADNVHQLNVEHFVLLQLLDADHQLTAIRKQIALQTERQIRPDRRELLGCFGGRREEREAN